MRRVPSDLGVGLWDDIAEAMKKSVGVRLTLPRLRTLMQAPVRLHSEVIIGGVI